eukprot:scaffold288222_cov15-Tisochrysis_lutea.AAC.1
MEALVKDVDSDEEGPCALSGGMGVVRRRGLQVVALPQASACDQAISLALALNQLCSTLSCWALLSLVA